MQLYPFGQKTQGQRRGHTVMAYTMSACWGTSGERHRDPHRTRQAWGVMLVQQCRGVSYLDDDAALAERAGRVDTGQPHRKPCRAAIAGAGRATERNPNTGMVL